jgi:hypothetical protein
MSIFQNLRTEIRDSFSTLLGIDGPALIDEETNLAYNKTIKTRMSGLIRNTRNNQSRELMDAISAAIDSDEEKDTVMQREAPFKLTKRMSSQKLLTSKSKKLPSATSLLNKPFSDQDIVQGEEAINFYEMDSLALTGKDLNRSFGSGMITKRLPEPKPKEKSSSRKSLNRLSRMGSIQSIVNAPLFDANVISPVTKPNFSSLGITASDLNKTFDDGLENALVGADPIKQGTSIANLINAPLNEEYGTVEDITIPMKEISLKQNVASLIQGEQQYFIASKDELKVENNQSTTVNISIEEEPLQPLLNVVPLNVPQDF